MEIEKETIELELLSIKNLEIRETLIFILNKTSLAINDIRDLVNCINNHC